MARTPIFPLVLKPIEKQALRLLAGQQSLSDYIRLRLGLPALAKGAAAHQARKGANNLIKPADISTR